LAEKCQDELLFKLKETTMHTPDKAKDTPQPKKPYKSPVVQVYGTIEKMTQNAGPRGISDAGGGAAAGPKTH
jgi:hypothetical protein